MFGKKKNSKSQALEKADVKDITYPAKIILAWAKALEGHSNITEWLLENGYKELVMTNSAIRLKDEARDWLLKNGFPHLMAMVNASEGNKQAQNWLLKHGFLSLYHMALAIEDERESWDWLSKNVPVDIFLLTQTIKKVKDQIEENHNDIHSFGKD